MTKLIRHGSCPFNCGSSDAYSEKVENGFIKGRCFSCNKYKRIATDLANTIEYKVYAPLPDHQLQEGLIPNIDRNLLYFYNIHTVDLWYLYLPCYLDNQFLGYQLKDLRKDPVIKYFTYMNDYLIYFTTQESGYKGDTIFITEDWLSSIAIKECGYESLAICGNNFTKKSHLFKFIREMPNLKNIYLWLDNDKAGKFGAEEIYNMLSNLYNCVNIKNVNEPKNLSLDDRNLTLRYYAVGFKIIERYKEVITKLADR